MNTPVEQASLSAPSLRKPRALERNLFLAVLLAIISVAVFFPVTSADFVHWDDDLNILNNPNIQSLDGPHLKWMFTDYSFMRRYIPMSWLTWAVTYHFFGLNPHAFHIEGLILHTINVLLVFWLIYKILSLTTRGDEVSRSPALSWLAALGALIWGLHPLRVEVVAWANCQMYAQSLLLLILSIACYFRASEKPGSSLLKNPFLWLSTFFFTLSLLTYPTAMGFVAVLLVIDVFLFKRLSLDLRTWFRRESLAVLAEKIPFIVVTLAVAGTTLWARAHLSEFWKDSDHLAAFGWPSRIAQAFYMWAYYLWKPWVSFSWCPVYTQLVSFQPTELRFLLSAAAIIGGTILFLWKRNQWPAALALWICHLALLVPMLGLTEHPHYPNDRYNYLSAVIWSVLIAIVLRSVWKNNLLRSAVAVPVFLLTCVFAASSFQQTKMWHNSVTLFQTVIQKLGDDPYRSDLYWRLGKSYAEVGKFDQAMTNYEEALKLSPSSAQVRIFMAEAFLAQGKRDDAMALYEKAVELDSRQSLAHYNLGTMLDEKGRVDEAIAHYRAALETDPQSPEAHHNLGNDLAKKGNLAEALEHILTSLKLNPRNSRAHINAGNILLAQQKVPEALDHLNDAVHLQPESAEAHYTFGSALAQSGRIQEAVPHFAATVRFGPKVPQGYLAYGMALSQTGQFAEAVKVYREALRVEPNFPRIEMNLGWILASHSDGQLRNGQEALQLAKHAVELSKEQDAEALDLLGAAYAECGKFPEAVAAMEKAVALADTKEQTDRSSQLRARLQQYQAGRALRQ